ncbi:MAG TPA: hypothetical protein PK079_15555 [Leptospiraceae bacterium]|nr:hypothetical protein [Leptospiraceae bacterium]HMW06085.1 hypothetical protein [Leptospiraceae bacterium]HMX33373.1 hypothetical protein [Leptospiraceae bacterium]HMY31373.1 hypothetical protein [Leptospiraceae bacterium]HMZ65007.1 hypothetical protein [Leptospiraceae bacterium]
MFEALDNDSSEIPKEAFLWILALYSLYFEFKISIDYESYDTLPPMDDFFESEEIYQEELNRIDYKEKLTGDIEKFQKIFRKLLVKTYPDDLDKLSFFLNLDVCWSEEEFIQFYTEMNESEITNTNDFCLVRDEKYNKYLNTVSIQNLEESKMMDGLAFVGEL